jgi:PilZ domain
MDRLHEFDRVTINLPREVARARERDFDCAVVAFDRATAILRPVDVLPAGLPRTLAHVTLLFEHEARLIGLRGVFILDDPYVLFTVEDGVQLARRRSTRTPLALSVTLTCDGEESPGATVNVAADGLLVEADIAVADGDRIGARLDLPQPVGRVEVPARVVRKGDGLVAVELEHDDSRVRAALMQLVVAQQTALLRRA